MKKLILSVIVALCSVFGTVAQNDVSINAFAGIGASGIMGEDADGLNAKFAYRFGVGVDVPFTQLWGFRTGLTFESLGANVDYGDVLNDLDTRMNMLYFEIPLMATATIDTGSALGITFNAGPYIGIGLGGKTRTSYDDDGVSYTQKSDVFGDNGFRRFDLGLGFGVNFDIDRFFFGVDTRFGLTSLHANTSLHNYAVFFGAGYRF